MNPLDPYPDPTRRERELERLADEARAELITYGTSVEGRPLRAIRIPSTATHDVPKVLCCANIHGPELIGNRVAVGLAERLARPRGEVERLRSSAEVWIAPCLNPDGYAHTWEAGGQGSLASLRTNARGVDLNRNFPLPPGTGRSPWPGAGNNRRGTATYVGEAPLSEPETKHLDALMSRHHYVASANLHSFMGSLITPRVTDRDHYRFYGELCRAFAAAQAHTRYFRLASRTFDTYTGEQEDHQHHEHGTWATCVEIFPIWASFRQHLRAPSLFWRFNPRDPARWVDNDVPGLVGYLLAALETASSLSRPCDERRGP